jgi:VanZ family protein
VLWAVQISIFSTDAFSGDHTRQFLLPLLHAVFPTLEPATLQALHDSIRKLAHPTEYAILGFLVFRALDHPTRRTARIFIAALVFCASYAALDEFHQSFVPSRGSSPFDVALDTSGAVVGLGLRARLRRPVSADRRSRA